jgi:hypothetical protein
MKEAKEKANKSSQNPSRKADHEVTSSAGSSPEGKIKIAAKQAEQITDKPKNEAISENVEGTRAENRFKDLPSKDSESSGFVTSLSGVKTSNAQVGKVKEKTEAKEPATNSQNKSFSSGKDVQEASKKQRAANDPREIARKGKKDDELD